jgi:DNA polymerase bacteriophage-type
MWPSTVQKIEGQHLMKKIHFDFETFSECDIRKQGAWAYSIHPSTRVLCMGYSINGGAPQLWTPDMDMPSILSAPGTHDQYHAWNSFFEWVIWNNVLKIHIPPLLQWYDTAALASAMALPRALGNCGLALGMKKDDAKSGRGYELIKLLSIPNKMNGNPALLKEMYAYCLQDVKAEMAISKKLFDLNPTERKVFVLDQKINTTGIAVDLDTVDKAKFIYAAAYEELMTELKKITGLDNPNSQQQFYNWLLDRGHVLENIRKETLRAVLLEEDKFNTHAAIDMRLKLAKSAPKKYTSIRDRVGNGTRLHGNTVYHGASTGRWAAPGVNLQNFARPTLDADMCISLIKMADLDVFEMTGVDPMEALSSSVRGMLVPSEGKKFIIGDYASIESRALAWLACQNDKLDIFRGHGKMYEYVASKIFKKDIEHITKPERFVGKIGELACGYGGGAGAIVGMAAVYKVDMTKPEAEKIKLDWRKENPEICAYWKIVEDAAINAVYNPGELQTAGRVKFMVAHNFLWCQLPSGRRLAYHRPHIKIETVHLIRVPSVRDPVTGEKKESSYNIMYSPHEYTMGEFKALAASMKLEIESFDAPTIHFWGTNSKTKKWSPQTTYGGKLVENITQGVARDLMVESMLILDEMRYNIVLTVHDEIISEVTRGSEENVTEFTQLMETVPEWAKGLPIKVEAYEAQRYRK